MLEIRKYESKDYEDVQYVCQNADGGGMNEEMRKVVLQLFCNYYIDNEGENCFVLADDGKAVGYVICASNYDEFDKKYNLIYKPNAIEIASWSKDWAENTYNLHEKYKEKYPAHLHIDILPEYQRGGWGRKLIDTLIVHLKNKGINGLILTTGPQNESAIKFYNKLGFTELHRDSQDVAFGKSI